MENNINLYIDNIIITMIGFDIEKIIMLYNKQYCKLGTCMILFRIRQH